MANFFGFKRSFNVFAATFVFFVFVFGFASGIAFRAFLF